MGTDKPSRDKLPVLGGSSYLHAMVDMADLRAGA